MGKSRQPQRLICSKSLGDAGFLQLFRVVSSGYGKPRKNYTTRPLFSTLFLKTNLGGWVFSKTKSFLGGGFKDFFFFHPYLGKWSVWTHIFQKGLKPPTRIPGFWCLLLLFFVSLCFTMVKETKVLGDFWGDFPSLLVFLSCSFPIFVEFKLPELNPAAEPG